MSFIKRWFERLLWNSRFVVLVAVVASIVAGFALFYLATVDVVYLVKHLAPYASSALSDGARAALRASTVTLEVKTTLDLLYFGATVAFIGLALFLSHRAEQHADAAGGAHAPPAEGR